MITLKLDSSAIRELIGDNEQMKMELSRAVVAEIVRQTLTKHLPEVVRTSITAICKDAVSELQTLIKEDSWVRESINKILNEEINTIKRSSYGTKISAARLKELNTAISGEVNDRVRLAIEERLKIVSDDLVEKVTERLEKQGGVISHDVRARMIQSITKEVRENLMKGLAST
jgi:hypothetical protein